LGRSKPAGRRRPGSAAPVGGASLDAATQPRAWQDFRLRSLNDPTDARPLFDFAAVPWPADVLFGWGASRDDTGPLAAVIAERAGRAVFLHGPIVNTADVGDPLELASELVRAAITHAAAVGADTAFTRPQGLDRVWIRFGFIPVPESALPAAFAGRPGAGLYGWRGGSALWSFRGAGDDDESAA
jgi:hypothetical protein